MRWLCAILLAGWPSLAPGDPNSVRPPATPGTINFAEGDTQTLQSEVDVRTGFAEILLSPGAVARTSANTTLRIEVSNSGLPTLTLIRGRVLVEVLPSLSDLHTSIRVGAAEALCNRPGLYVFDTKGITTYSGKLLIRFSAASWKLAKGHTLELVGTPRISRIGKPDLIQDALYQWSGRRSQALAAISKATARQVLDRHEKWNGSGWYWNLQRSLYTYLPDDGTVTSPFGWIYASPYEEYAPLRPFLSE